MSPFKFACQNCGQRLAAFEDQIGTSEPCPACGTMVKVVAPSPSPASAPRDTTAEMPADEGAELKISETMLSEATTKAAPLITAAAEASKDPVTVDTRHLAPPVTIAPQEGREPSVSKSSNRSAVADRSPVSGARPATAPGDMLHRVWQRIQASRFLSISLMLHTILVLLVGGLVLFPAIVERADFEAGADGKLVQSPDQSELPDLPTYAEDKAAEFTLQTPPLTVLRDAMVTATQREPTWTVKMMPPAPVRGLSDSMKGALDSVKTKTAAAPVRTATAGAALGRSGGLRTSSIFGKKITAIKLGVILDFSGSALPHIANAVDEIHRGFSDAIIILYPGCGMKAFPGPSQHVIRNLPSIPRTEYPDNSGAYFTTIDQLADAVRMSPAFVQMLGRPTLKDTLFVSWYAPTGGTPGSPDRVKLMTQVAFEDLMNRGVDTIYWFADFGDPIDPRVAEPLVAKLQEKRIKVHLFNFAGTKMDFEPLYFAEKTGGTTTTDRLKK